MISGGRDTRRKKEVGELKSTGIVRPVDNLGRIVLPIELRRVLDIDKDAAREVYVDNDSIVLKKYQPAARKKPPQSGGFPFVKIHAMIKKLIFPFRCGPRSS